MRRARSLKRRAEARTRYRPSPRGPTRPRKGSGLRFKAHALALSQEARPMKPLMVAALLSALSTVALAKTTPIERLPDNKNMVSVETMQESTASIGAMREREHFEPP